MSLDVLAVGDVVTDGFIKLFDDRATTFENENGKWLAMPFTAKVPFEKAVVVEGVGNAANAAVSFARLGLKSGLISNVGEDQFGKDIILALKKENVDARFVHVNHGKISNYHYVLWYKEDRTILINHEEYNYEWPKFKDEDVPKWIYFSSISKNALDKYHDFVADWLAEHPDVKLAFQPGTFQLEAGAERLANLYKLTEVIVVNREEAVQITGGSYDNLHELIDKLHELGPKKVIVTDGPDGAYASDGQVRLKMPPYPDPAPPLERTGAGDAFASTLVAAFIKGNNLEGALQWAPINSMNVVQNVGAQEGLLSDGDIAELLKNAPEWYKAEPF